MAEIVPLELSSHSAIKMIRDLASDSGNIVVIEHAKKRQKQRRITRRQIVNCLRMGTVTEGPILNMHGNWQVNLYNHAAGEELTCVVAIEWATRLIVVTAF